MENKLLKINAHLTIDYFNIKTIELSIINETNTNFIIKSPSGKTARINKSKLLLPDTIFLEKSTLISYYTYSFEKDFDEAKQILISKINEVLTDYTSNIAMMRSKFDDSEK